MHAALMDNSKLWIIQSYEQGLGPTSSDKQGPTVDKAHRDRLICGNRSEPTQKHLLAVEDLKSMPSLMCIGMEATKKKTPRRSR